MSIIWRFAGTNVFQKGPVVEKPSLALFTSQFIHSEGCLIPFQHILFHYAFAPATSHQQREQTKETTATDRRQTDREPNNHGGVVFYAGVFIIRSTYGFIIRITTRYCVGIAAHPGISTTDII
jgi:hypothetical protein